MLAMLTDDSVSQHLEEVLEMKNRNQLVIEAGAEDGLDKVLDHEGWKSFIREINTLSEDDGISCLLLQHFGTTMTSRHRGLDIHGNNELDNVDKKQARVETCLALRILELMCIAIDTFTPA